MLDAFIIKRIQEEKHKKRQQRPSLEVERPNRPPSESAENPKTDSKRGITVIDFSI
tara:strand:- start:120 stop:287 length:168 start_codon:yes stop_codon:yes gene_type:complete